MSGLGGGNRGGAADGGDRGEASGANEGAEGCGRGAEVELTVPIRAKRVASKNFIYKFSTYFLGTFFSCRSKKLKILVDLLFLFRLASQMKSISKKTLAVVKAWEECRKEVENFDNDYSFMERLESFESKKIKANVLDFNIYSEYFTDLTKYVDSAKILRGMVPQVAKEAGFSKLVPFDTPVVRETIISEFWVYEGEVPMSIVEAYHQDPKTWIEAFAKVMREDGSLPCMCEFVKDSQTKEYFSEWEDLRFKAVSAILLEEDPSTQEWERVMESLALPELTLEEENEIEENLYQHLGLQELTPEARELRSKRRKQSREKLLELEAIFNTKVQENMAKFLRPQPQKPHPAGEYIVTKVVQQRPDTFNLVTMLMQGMGCDNPVIESLVFNGAFNAKKE